MMMGTVGASTSSGGVAPPPQGAVIEVRHLHMRYGAKTVLSDLEFSVSRGEVVTLLGPNGAGKTTTIEILEGFRARSGGHVNVLGTDPAQGSEHWRARLGIVLQSWRDHGRWKVKDLLHHLGRYYGPYSTPGRQRPIPTDQLIDMVGLGEQQEQKVSKLSGGQRRRLDVAIGIVGRPEVLFLDEPTAGLDPHGRREFHDLVHQLSDMEETTILLTTHDLSEAEKLADRILILAGSRIIADGSAEQLARQVSNQAEVRWSHSGEFHVHATDDATTFVRKLFAQYGDGVGDLEVRRASLEDTYLSMVHRLETSDEDAVVTTLERGPR